MLGVLQRAIAHDNAELVAADSRQCVAVPNTPSKQLGELDEKLVASGGATGFVDNLEAVDINVADGVLDRL